MPPVPDEMIEEAPTTKRLSARDLARALAAMELTEEEQRPSTDDEPTIDAPAPPIPPGVRSPLGDDSEGDAENQPPVLDADDDVQTWRTDETLTLRGLGVDLEGELPFLLGTSDVARANEDLRTEGPDVRRTRMAVIASWTLAGVVLALFTYIVATAGPTPYEPRPAPRTPLDAEPSR